MEPAQSNLMQTKPTSVCCVVCCRWCQKTIYKESGKLILMFFIRAYRTETHCSPFSCTSDPGRRLTESFPLTLLLFDQNLHELKKLTARDFYILDSEHRISSIKTFRLILKMFTTSSASQWKKNIYFLLNLWI